MPCQIDARKFKHIMLDLGFAMNIMSDPIYSQFQTHILHLADILVQLVDHSLVRLVGLVKDVLVRVNRLTFSPLTFM